MGAGKTTVGRALAQKLEGSFLDHDDFIVQLAQKSIPQIFEQDGESYFRQFEHDCLEFLLTGKSDRFDQSLLPENMPTVIAGGGGVAMRDDNRALIKDNSLCIYLHLDVEHQYERVKDDTNRPMIYVDDIKARLQSLFESRDPQYHSIAAIVVDTNCPIKDVVKRCLQGVNVRCKD